MRLLEPPEELEELLDLVEPEPLRDLLELEPELRELELEPELREPLELEPELRDLRAPELDRGLLEPELDRGLLEPELDRELLEPELDLDLLELEPEPDRRDELERLEPELELPEEELRLDDELLRLPEPLLDPDRPVERDRVDDPCELLFRERLPCSESPPESSLLPESSSPRSFLPTPTAAAVARPTAAPAITFFGVDRFSMPSPLSFSCSSLPFVSCSLMASPFRELSWPR